jgi:photosystem II stability/assembly factor-like uncharacterized protein
MKHLSILLVFVICLFSCEKRQKKNYVDRPTGWKVFQTPVTASLRGLSPVTENIIWASGAGGTWLRTTDGGNTWNSGIIAGLDSVDFRDIEGLDASTAVAISAGQPALVYKTTDGGQTWNKTHEGTEKDFFVAMYFQRGKGTIIGDPVDGKWRILQSKELGSTWREIEREPEGLEGSGSFAASGSTLLVHNNLILFASGGINSDIYRSEDGGMHWKKIQTPIIQGEASQGIFSITKIDDNIFVGVGGDYLQASLAEKNAIFSKDGGKSWALSEGNMPSGYRSGVTYFPLHHWLITVGPSGSDFSKDGGLSWERFSEEGFHGAVRDKSQSSIWASGSNGKIAKLTY